MFFLKRYIYIYIYIYVCVCVSCRNFWDEAWWFLSLRVFGLLSSSLLLFPQRFGRYVLRPSSGFCCLNFWDEACWFLSLRFFGLLSSSLLLFVEITIKMKTIVRKPLMINTYICVCGCVLFSPVKPESGIIPSEH